MATMCRVLGVSPSGYWAWAKRPPSARARSDERLTATIRAIHRDSRGTYGMPRVHAELRDTGTGCSRKRVARLMRVAGLEGVHRRRSTRTTIRDRDTAPAPDLVERMFTANCPDTLWVADITYVPTWQGFLYVAVVIDVFSRRVVGWSMAGHLRTELILDALEMAIARRRPGEGLIHHSDRGTQGGIQPIVATPRDEGGPRWASASATRRSVRCGVRSGRLAGHRQRGVRTGSGSGRRSLVARPARLRQVRPGWHPRSDRDGSATLAGCHPSVWLRCRSAICRSLSGKRSRSCTRNISGFVASLAISVVHPRRSPGNCVATRRRAATPWRIERRPPSGTPNGAPAAPRSPSSRRTTRFTGTSRTALPA